MFIYNTQKHSLYTFWCAVSVCKEIRRKEKRTKKEKKNKEKKARPTNLNPLAYTYNTLILIISLLGDNILNFFFFK